MAKLMQAQALAKLSELQEQEEERLAACINRQNREQLLRAKSSQKLRERSAELRQLQQQIETAAVVMGRELQLQERQMLAEHERAYNDAFDAMLADERAKVNLLGAWGCLCIELMHWANCIKYEKQILALGAFNGQPHM